MQSNAIRIPETDIADLFAKAEGYLAYATTSNATEQPISSAAFSYTPATLPTKPSAPVRKAGAGLRAALAGDKGSSILSPARHKVLYSATRGFAIGEATGELFVEPLGYLDLAMRKKESRLAGIDAERFAALVRAKSLASVFVAAAYIASTCAAAPTTDNLEGDIELDLGTTADAFKAFAGILVKAVEGTRDEDLDEAVSRAVNRVMTWAEHQSHRAMGQYRPDFEAKAYAVEADGFSVHGFQRQGGAKRKASSDIQFKKPSDVVGNHVAKAQGMRLAKMLASYDFARRENPFVRLGGFTYTIMGDGNPGTGKTTLIQMVCGLIKDFCDVGGYPYHFENFGVDQVSEYQGKSGQNARAFIERIQDPRVIAFGTIDDIDQVAGKRDDSKSSGGQQEITAVLMDAFAGASTIVRGNCSYGMFSNYPEKVDDALRQRAGARWLVDGPQTLSDYIDIFYLLVGKNHKLQLGSHDLFKAQTIQEMAEKSYESHARPHEQGLQEVFDAVVGGNGQPKTIADIGAYLHAIRMKEPRFTGRAIKNITDAIKTRSMDIDLPDEWFEKPELYMHKPFEEKCAMLEELRKPITMEMVMQEINRYADSEFRYSAKSDDAAISELVRQHGIHKAAQARIGGDA
ncbi:AAA family ATPase [Sinorhizobium meliloti]|nr:AAA family ATPase [Sinorhizobium meliloti]